MLEKASSLMRWYVRTTRFATTHLVRLQENEESCGPNCAAMVHCRMNKVTTVTHGMAIEQSIVETVRANATGLSTWDPSREYTQCGHLSELLNKFVMGQWEYADVGEEGVTAAAVASASVFQLSTVPIIALVNWTSVQGSHFVMIDGMIKKPLGDGYWALVADPWDGHVHVTSMTPGQRVVYNNATPYLSWSIPPIPPARIGGADGVFSRWVVRCTGMSVMARLGKIMLGAGV